MIWSQPKSGWPALDEENFVNGCAKHLRRWGSVRLKSLLTRPSLCTERLTERRDWWLSQEPVRSAVVSMRAANASVPEVGGRLRAMKAAARGLLGARCVQLLMHRMVVVQRHN